MKDTDSVYSRDLEVINQLDDGFSVGVGGIAVPHLKKQTHLCSLRISVVLLLFVVVVVVVITHTSEQFDLIQSCLSVMWGTFYHLQSHKPFLPEQKEIQTLRHKLDNRFKCFCDYYVCCESVVCCRTVDPSRARQ